ncbi:hypothetical protein [Photobacterium kishitanii]|uniref:Polymer-forming cytoskeletal protein n=1 Tax=Photobacterium kishitanii TaxID=318456 RepID=A0A2T3KME6_9GAMM|nr:hypothetical protein [Photobacterium kishitanii]PSV00954.1 hypothetical protein C9J27_02710 [Photobacterium kishitanii]
MKKKSKFRSLNIIALAALLSLGVSGCVVSTSSFSRTPSSLQPERLSLNVGKAAHNNVIINGQSYSVAKEITVFGSGIYVDGKKQPEKIYGDMTVIVHGDVKSMNTVNGNVKANNVRTITTTSGNIKAKNVAGNIETVSGDVSCGDVSGSVSSISGKITLH